ncbi:hypothetical protein JXB12_01775 [candidate division KSB1 bacterium]|nr:hypothetical protein [candidate division KSB1 bacterium]
MEEYVRILILKNEIEWHVMKNVLEENEIPYVMKSYHDSAYDGIFQFQKGWGHVEAPVEYKEKILHLYDQMMKNQ